MCVNANTVVSERLNVHSLLQRSVCPYDEEFPKCACIDHVCAHCGVQSLQAELESIFEGRLKQSISWCRWESVKQGRSSHVKKIRKTGSVEQCLAELLTELGPLLCKFSMQNGRKTVQSAESRASTRVGPGCM